MTGYKDPPKHTQWRKGQSGNPKGRVKGQKNLKTDLAEEMNETIRLNEGGVPRKLTKQRALVKSLAAKAIKGDGRAAGLLINLMLRLLEVDTNAVSGEPLSQEDEAVIAAFLGRQMSDIRPSDTSHELRHDAARRS